MTFNRQKYHAIVAAIVAVILVLPATPVLAQTRLPPRRRTVNREFRRTCGH